MIFSSLLLKPNATVPIDGVQEVILFMIITGETGGLKQVELTRYCPWYV
jgi:hypothetical protein